MKPIRTWQKIAAEAAIEKDSEKLLQLAVELELELALEEREKKLHRQRCGPGEDCVIK